VGPDILKRFRIVEHVLHGSGLGEDLIVVIVLIYFVAIALEARFQRGLERRSNL
jgi:hypothetical protein